MSIEKLHNYFFDACENGDLDKVKYYLTSPDLPVHADIHFKDDYAIRIACAYRQLKIVQYLLTSPDLTEHANIQISSNNNGFMFACQSGDIDIVKYLLHYSQNFDIAKGINRACSYDQLKVVDYLIQLGGDMSKINAGLISACENGHLNIVKYLLETPQLKDVIHIHDENDKAFLKACYNEHIPILQYLIFDYNIEKTDNIIDYLENNTYGKEIIKLFSKRELNEALQKNLNKQNNTAHNKNKI